MYIAEIDTTGLIPATLHGDEQLVETLFVENSLTVVTSDANKRRVHIPVWVRDTARPADGSNITPQQLTTSGADMWVSVDEQRMSDIGIRCSTSHDKEWLCCGPVPLEHIDRVMPYDGKTVYGDKRREVV